MIATQGLTAHLQGDTCALHLFQKMMYTYNNYCAIQKQIILDCFRTRDSELQITFANLNGLVKNILLNFI